MTDNFDFPKKVRKYDADFQHRSKKSWYKSELTGKLKTNWAPETPPKLPTDNPWVDSLDKQPNAPESHQTCHPSKWKYGKQYRAGAHYSFGRPFVDKDGWFILWKFYGISRLCLVT